LLKDLFASWVNENKVRITSPVLGAFIGAWVLLNWQQFFLLFWGNGSIDERLASFNSIVTLSNCDIWLWPLLLAFVYAFGLPYLNALTHRLAGHAEKIRHKVVIDINIEKAKQKAQLNEEIYKANPSNPYLGRKLESELKQQEAMAEKAKADAEAAAAAAKQAIANEEKETAQAKLVNAQAEETQRKEDREKLAHERAKAKHHQELVNSRFPLIYQFLTPLSESLTEAKCHATLSLITEAISQCFGFEDVEDMFSDEKFTLSTLENLACVAYDEESFISELDDLAQKHGTELGGEELFNHLIQAFETADICKLTSKSYIDDYAADYIDDSSNLYELLDGDAVSSVMADTNAYFDEIEDAHIKTAGLEKDGSIVVHASATINGTNHEDKPFSGDSINVQFELTFKPILGLNGYDKPTIENVRAGLNDY
jgi:hypothetical protein